MHTTQQRRSVGPSDSPSVCWLVGNTLLFWRLRAFLNIVSQECVLTLCPDIVSLHCVLTLCPNIVSRCCFPILFPDVVSRRCFLTLFPDVVSRHFVPTLFPDIVSQYCVPTLCPNIMSQHCVTSIKSGTQLIDVSLVDKLIYSITSIVTRNVFKSIRSFHIRLGIRFIHSFYYFIFLVKFSPNFY